MKHDLEHWKHRFATRRDWWRQTGPDDTAGFNADLALAQRIEEVQTWTELVAVLSKAGLSRYVRLCRERRVVEAA